MLESSPVIAGAIIIKTLTNNLSTADNDASMTIMKRGQSSLLDAKGEIIISLHLDRFEFSLNSWIGGCLDQDRRDRGVFGI